MSVDPTPSQDDRLWAMLSHLLAIVAPILAPLIIFAVKKDQSRFTGFHALQSTFLDLAMIVLTTAASIIGAVTCLPLLLLPFIGIGWLVLKVMAGLKANTGEWYEIPVVGRMARQQVGV